MNGLIAIKQNGVVAAALLLVFVVFSASGPQAAKAQSKGTQGDKIKITRAAIDWVRKNYFTQGEGKPWEHHYDHEAIAVAPKGVKSPEEDVLPEQAASKAHAQAVSQSMGKPYGVVRSFIECTDPEVGELRECEMQGVESVFVTGVPEIQDDMAQIRIEWVSTVDRDLFTHSFLLRLEKDRGKWTVRDLLTEGFH